MADESKTSKPDIIVDDDWKAQVEKEKEALRQEAQAPAGDAADSLSGGQADESGPFEMPPASFVVLMSTLATQAMASMGMIPDPATGKPSVNRPMAKHFIDTLAMLQEKTKGNLTEEESAHLRDALHQLRMAFVSLAEKTPAQQEPEKKSSIELP